MSIGPPVRISDGIYSAEAPEPFSAKGVGITDGDTVDVTGSDGANYLHCSPRWHRCSRHDQAFETQSTQYLASVISSKTVTLECGNERSYGRLICKILLPRAEDLFETCIS